MQQVKIKLYQYHRTPIPYEYYSKQNTRQSFKGKNHLEFFSVERLPHTVYEQAPKKHANLFLEKILRNYTL